jgi:hypothetical protein
MFFNKYFSWKSKITKMVAECFYCRKDFNHIVDEDVNSWLVSRKAVSPCLPMPQPVWLVAIYRLASGYTAPCLAG